MNPDPDPSRQPSTSPPDLQPDRNAGTEWAPSASWPMVKLRAHWLARLRQFFAERDFLEVETPLLADETVVDRHLDPIAVPAEAVGHPASGDQASYWLQTSPELAMKRLLASDNAPPAIYQITRSFRAGEAGVLHNPEFTIVEWYRAGDDYRQGMDLLEELAAEMFPAEPIRRVSYCEAFEQSLGVHPLLGSMQRLRELATTAGLPVPESLSPDDRDGWLDALFSLGVQPWLGRQGSVILHDYPASQAALARVRASADGDVAERFELFVQGVELANGYHELLDADELQRRTAEANRARTADGKPQLPAPRRLLAAMRHGLPHCSGTALGFDRALMLLANCTRLRDVLAFPLSGRGEPDGTT